MNKGCFITFEGGEGAGKTTLIRRLESALQEHHYQTLVTREPGGSPLGEKIRQLLLDCEERVAIGHKAELLLFLAGRAQHLEEVIRPALEQGRCVLCDRFNDSTVAYQGIARKLGQNFVQQLCDLVCGSTLPQLTFFLDLDPMIGMQRVQKEMRVMDRLENEEHAFHEKVRQGFLTLAAENPHRIAVIDANQPAEVVFAKAWDLLQDKLNNHSDHRLDFSI